MKIVKMIIIVRRTFVEVLLSRLLSKYISYSKMEIPNDSKVAIAHILSLNLSLAR